MNPRTDLLRTSRRAFLKASTAATAALGFGCSTACASPPRDEPQPLGDHPNAAQPEWRNRHPDMAYRMLGRTGFMISEVVYGGYLIKPDSVHLYEAALDRGLNYLDQAASYGNGAGEMAIAALLKRGVARDRFFLTTKLSHYNGYVHRRYEERFHALPAAKQQAVQELADRLLVESGNTRPGYHVNYFKGQESPFPREYRVTAMKRLGIQAGTKQQFKDKLVALLEESMERTTADYYDVLFCPHSVESPASFDDEAMVEGLTEIKAQGKARALAFSAHNDTGQNLEAGVASGLYDAAMVAYNIVNHLAMEPVIRRAAAAGVGVIAMKVARPVVVDPLDWRIAKLNAIVPTPDLSLPQKAYLFALQNPDLSAVIADMGEAAVVEENLAVAGRKTRLNLV